MAGIATPLRDKTPSCIVISPNGGPAAIANQFDGEGGRGLRVHASDGSPA